MEKMSAYPPYQTEIDVVYKYNGKTMKNRINMLDK